jgi:hypothetical protein
MNEITDHVGIELIGALRGHGVSDRAMAGFVARLKEGDPSLLIEMARLDPELMTSDVSPNDVYSQVIWRARLASVMFDPDYTSIPKSTPTEGVLAVMPGASTYTRNILLAVTWLDSTLELLGITPHSFPSDAEPLDLDKFRPSELARTLPKKPKMEWLNLRMTAFGDSPSQVAGIEYLFALAQQPRLMGRLTKGRLATTIIVQGIDYRDGHGWGHLRLDFSHKSLVLRSHRSLTDATDGSYQVPIIHFDDETT